MVTEKRREITDDEILKFLEGHDPQERIVNIECFNNNDFATIYYRDENDIKHKTTEPFYPFLWARKTACLKLCNGDRNEIKRLLKKHNIAVKKLDTTNVNGEIVEKMNDGYTFMFYSTKPQSYSDFLKFFKEANNPVYRDNKKQQKEAEDSYDIKQNDRQYLAITSVEQFLISTGKRMFKGYEDYDCLLRLIFDLETTGLDVNKDRIEQFGVRFNRPVLYKGKKYDFEKIFTVKGNTEEEKDKSELYNIENFLKIIYTFQPDVITAHNGEAFDWRIIIGACERLGTSLEEISKKYFNDTPIKKDNRETILKLGGEVETFNRTIVPYTIVTDSLHAVRRAQATDSNFKEANLKYATKYLELSKENRVYVPGNKISDVWNDTEKHYAFNDKNGDWYLYSPDSQKQFEFDGNTKRSIIKQFNNIGKGYVLVNGEYIVTRYLLDDLWECDKVESSLNQSAFNICKYLPLHFQKCCTMGTAGQWKSLMLAWSYENDLAIPYAENTGKFTGGLSRLLSVGSTGDGGLVKLDYNSLYPSIILTWGIEDENDLSGATLKFLNYFLTTRETYKKKKKEADKLIEKYEDKINNGQTLTEEESSIYSKALNNFAYYDKLQSVRKVFCNSFFGSYGSNRGSVYPWKSIDCAERTTCTGRQSLRLLINHFSNIGTSNGLDNDYNYKPIVGDSFSEDTPILIKYKSDGCIDIKPISELIDESEIQIDELGREYDYSQKDYLVLCRSGWVEPSYIYRHKTDKDMYEVTDGDMKVEVTEDHSLFNSKKEKIKPSEITDDTKLEYYCSEILTNNSISTLDFKFPEVYAIQLANGEIDRVPTYFLNHQIYGKRFYDTFIQNSRDDIKYSKTCLAGLLFLRDKCNFNLD
jgi:DNA polymerase elongation subunit (family B)